MKASDCKVVLQVMACDSYRVDLTAHGVLCKCGYPKGSHAVNMSKSGSAPMPPPTSTGELPPAQKVPAQKLPPPSSTVTGELPPPPLPAPKLCAPRPPLPSSPPGSSDDGEPSLSGSLLSCQSARRHKRNALHALRDYAADYHTHAAIAYNHHRVACACWSHIARSAVFRDWLHVISLW